MILRRYNNSRRGVAMLIVLFVVMAIMLVSFGFVARTNSELFCGSNAVLRMKMDYLAQSALTHAKALIVSPDNATPMGAWQGTELQIIGQGADDYYDISISDPVIGDPNGDPIYTYTVQCEAYKKQGTEKVALSDLNARFHYVLSTGSAFYKSIQR